MLSDMMYAHPLPPTPVEVNDILSRFFKLLKTPVKCDPVSTFDSKLRIPPKHKARELLIIEYLISHSGGLCKGM